jgi:hypothetical protein
MLALNIASGGAPRVAISLSNCRIDIDYGVSNLITKDYRHAKSEILYLQPLSCKNSAVNSKGVPNEDS